MKTVEDGWYIVINTYKVYCLWDLERFFLYYHILRVHTILTYTSLPTLWL